MDSETDNVLLRPVVAGVGPMGTLVGQVVTVREICDMVRRSTNPGIDPSLSVLTVQTWLTEPIGQDLANGPIRTATRELAHQLAKRRFSATRSY